MLECRDALLRWGFTIPPRDNVHPFARQRMSFPANTDLKSIGKALEFLSRLRNKADYHLSQVPEFADDVQAAEAIREAEVALKLLDQIEGDPGRLAGAIAAIRTAFP